MMTDDQITKLSDELTNSALAYIEKKAKGKELHVTVHLVKNIVAKLVYSALMSAPGYPMDKTELIEFTKQNFDVMKSNVQDAVSSGMREAVTQYSGIQTDYYCILKPIGEPANKMPC